MDGGESSGRPKCLNSFSEHINVVRQTSLEEKVLFVGKIGDNKQIRGCDPQNDFIVHGEAFFTESGRGASCELKDKKGTANVF